MKRKIGVINAGAWGTAISKVLAENGHKVHIWDFMDSVVQDINKNHRNNHYLPEVDLPKSITATTDIVKAANKMDYLFVATPSLFIEKVIKDLAKVPSVADGKTRIGVLTKGFIPKEDNPKLILSSMENILPPSYTGNLVYISGPSHAEEVAIGKLTGLISASQNGVNSIRYRELFNGTNVVVFSSLDTIGVQTCGAVKNVIAIGFGILDALGEMSPRFGDNTESLLLAAGLNEIQTIGMALGSTHPETFTSIAGVGDLDVTCRSKHGRNRRFGREIITARVLNNFKDIEDLIANMSRIGYLSEGVVAAKYTHQLMAKYNIKLSVCEAVYSILNRESDPRDSIQNLMKTLSMVP